jgi:hypothetical protein
MQELSDNEIMEQIHEARKWIDKYQELINENKSEVDVKDIRKEMSKLNHLKMEARKRGLQAE